MSEGVEWAVHCCLVLDWLGDEEPVSTARLAAGYELSPSYLNKHLQALARAGLVTSTPGARGGFRLARPAHRITLLDVVTAIEGPDDAFQCTEIRRRGVGATAPERTFRAPCSVASAMRKAELAWRRELKSRTIADLRHAAERQAPGIRERLRPFYLRS